MPLEFWEGLCVDCFGQTGQSSSIFFSFELSILYWGIADNRISYSVIAELKNLCFWTVVLEKTLESPLDCKEINPVRPKGNQSWIFIGRTDAPILWPPDVKNWFIGKDPDAAKDEDRRRGDRGWDGWMPSLTGWTWVWISSGSWWWTGKLGVLQFMRSQRVRHDWRLNWRAD